MPQNNPIQSSPVQPDPIQSAFRVWPAHRTVSGSVWQCLAVFGRAWLCLYSRACMVWYGVWCLLPLYVHYIPTRRGGRGGQSMSVVECLYPSAAAPRSLFPSPVHPLLIIVIPPHPPSPLLPIQTPYPLLPLIFATPPFPDLAHHPHFAALGALSINTPFGGETCRNM